MDSVIAHQTLKHTYVWYDVSPRKADLGPRESGIETSMLIVENPLGEQVGYLAISFAHAETLAKYHENPFMFADHHMGACLGFDDGQIPTMENLWVEAHRHMSTLPASLKGKPLALWNLNVALAPQDMSMLLADLEVLKVEIRTKLQRWENYFKVPFVAFASVDREYRRQGIATVMYEVAAKQLAKTGRVLRASGTQSVDAKGLWGKFNETNIFPMRAIKLNGLFEGSEDQTYQCIDFSMI